MQILNIIMAGVDYELATISQRETFSFTKSQMAEIYTYIKEDDRVLGVVIISTCNRTEIYLSCVESCEVNPFELLCESICINFLEYKSIHNVYFGEDMIQHLFLLACGVKSQIWGEGQIIAQVKTAVEYAREQNSTDSVLEVLFRTAVTGAKKVRSTVVFKSTDVSSASKAVDIVRKCDNVKKVLVIGNGEIGRLVCDILIKYGYDTTMTLRHYKHSQNIVPDGANTMDYIDRYEFMNECDCVISATLSPHHTVELERVSELYSIPCLFIDLAVPRDIDPEIIKMQGVKYYNVDDISREEIQENHTVQLEQIEAILEKYITNFYNWCSYKELSVASSKAD